MARLDVGGAASGATSGAVTGGSVLGLPGAVGGAILGGISGLFGKKKKKKKVSTLDKRQQMINEQQAQALQGKGPLADLYNYDPEAANAVFDKDIARPAYRDFQEKTIPGITGAFRNEGLQTSSYAGDALAREGRNVQESLDAQRAKYLYGERGAARQAKRSAIEDYQNRSTMAYDANADQGGFDIDKIIESVGPENLDKLAKWLEKQKGI